MKRALLIALLLLAVACATTTPTVDPPLETTATLRVFQEQREGSMYMEGQISYLSINGTEHQFQPETLEASLVIEMEVRVGEIDLESWQRPCSGNCDSLDPPANQCATTVEAGAGQTLRILVSFSPGPDPCVLETLDEDPASFSDAG